ALRNRPRPSADGPSRLLDRQRGDLDLVARDRSLDRGANVVGLLGRLERGDRLLVAGVVELEVLAVRGEDSVAAVLARERAFDRMLVRVALALVAAWGIDERHVLEGSRRQHAREGRGAERESSDPESHVVGLLSPNLTERGGTGR